MTGCDSGDHCLESHVHRQCRGCNPLAINFRSKRDASEEIGGSTPASREDLQKLARFASQSRAAGDLQRGRPILRLLRRSNRTILCLGLTAKCRGPAALLAASALEFLASRRMLDNDYWSILSRRSNPTLAARNSHQ